MHVDDAQSAARLVQGVDILGDDHDLAGPVALQPSQRLMRRIGPGGGGLHTARIVEAVHQPRIAGKAFGRGDILDPVLLPEAACIAEGAKPAFRRQPRPRQDHDLFHSAPMR